MEEQYNGILFFNDNIYLLKFINDLLNRAPTEENFKYLAKLIAYIERDGQAKMDGNPIDGEIDYTKLQMTSRFIAAAQNFIINLASKKYPGREFEFRVLSEEMIQKVNMSVLDDPLQINHSLEEVIEVQDELDPYKDDKPMDTIEPENKEAYRKPVKEVKPEYENEKPVQDIQVELGGMDEYYKYRFPSKPEVPKKPIIENPQNNMDVYYNLRFRNYDNQSFTPQTPEMETGGRTRR